jgi:leucyl/phenylalanyl-tRNA--protein transferase
MESAVELAQAMLHGYAQGVFAMDEGEGIHWYDPDPRAVLGPNGLHISRSLRRSLNSGRFSVSIDQCTEAVIRACAMPTKGREETWISPAFLEAVLLLVDAGWVHSVSVHRAGELVGGVYGIHINGVFFAESMFSRPSQGTDASKVALVHLVEHCHHRGITLIDCQFLSDHLASLGFVEVTRANWHTALQQAIGQRADWSPSG